jgi:hypothetical protein
MAATPVSPAPEELTRAQVRPDIVEMPGRTFLALSGSGGPDSTEFAASIGALYGVAYGVKFGRKSAGADFKVGPLVGVWSAEGAGLAAGGRPSRDAWRWTLQLDVPADVTAAQVEQVAEMAVSKKGGKLEGSPHALQVRLVSEPPRRYARILHVGPYADEPRSFAVMQQMLDSEGLAREPWHIEVYMSDPGRTAPDKLKTVLLAPVM